MNCLRCNSPMYEQLYDDVLDSQGQGFYAIRFHLVSRASTVKRVRGSLHEALACA